MKALDTGVLLALLEGSPKARDLVRKLRGVEVATTELNLVELASLAGAGRTSSKRRLAALDRLRQRLSVLPVDARAGRESLRLIGRAAPSSSPSVVAMIGALQAAGCDELLTDDPRSLPAETGLRVRTVAV